MSKHPGHFIELVDVLRALLVVLRQVVFLHVTWVLDWFLRALCCSWDMMKEILLLLSLQKGGHWFLRRYNPKVRDGKMCRE